MFRRTGIFVIIIIIMSISVYYLYYMNDYDRELDRIAEIEKRMNLAETDLKNKRMNLKACSYNYTNPRDCYVQSGYTCKWDEDAGFCTKI